MTDHPSHYTTSLPPATRVEMTAAATSHAICDSSPAFVLDTESSQVPLTVRTTGEAPSGSFIVLTLVTNVRNRPDTRSTVTFESRPTVNQRLMEIASSTVATTASNREDRHTSESQGTSAARPTQSSTSSSDQHPQEEHRNRNYYSKNNQSHFTTRTWENSYTHRTCNSCGEKGYMQRELYQD